jgi:hypothetical protein
LAGSIAEQATAERQGAQAQVLSLLQRVEGSPAGDSRDDLAGVVLIIANALRRSAKKRTGPPTS